MVMMKIALCLILCTAVNQVSTKWATACTDRIATLSCNTPDSIVVKDVMYGRQVPYSKKCFYNRGTPNTNCRGKEATGIVRKKCDGKEKCRVVTNGKLGPDPCVGTYKYTDYIYGCGQVMPMFSMCKGQKGMLKCERGYQIFILDTMYGRQVKYEDKCSSRKSKEITHCRSEHANAILQTKCNFRSRCRVASNNSMGPNPCPGTDKYTEITYACIRRENKKKG